jgi:hypothetical protein
MMNQDSNQQNMNPQSGSNNLEFNHLNMQTGQVRAQMNHGGHEMFDVHEMLNGIVGALNLNILCKGHVQDPELKTMLIRHYQHITKEINSCVQAFQTGKYPAMRTESYKIIQDNLCI